jgi:cytoskeletal protein RodZ
MHVAVLIALLGFLSIAKMVFGAFAEMSWWRGEPYLIYDASSLKPTSMLLSAGLLLIYVILCVVSFITARKEMAAQAARDAAKKAAVLKKASMRKSIDDEAKPKGDKPSDPKASQAGSESKKDTDGKATPSADAQAPSGTPNDSDRPQKAPSAPETDKPSARHSPSAEKTETAEKSDEQAKTPTENKEDSDKPAIAPEKSPE